ncbi:hypothetical protein F5877DRAFT_75326 [Lentinula edodes]|nr:hypothetical protein F5877DRAFT_75326 [Lentinula edodes]
MKTPPKPSAPDKRPRPRQDNDDDSDDEDNEYLFEGGISVGVGGVTGTNGNRKSTGRLPGACTARNSRSVDSSVLLLLTGSIAFDKMKCDFPLNDNTCKRCKAGGHVCIIEGRKPRTAPNKREYLLTQIRQKDMIIESLLKEKLNNPYVATPLSIASYRMATSPSDSSNDNVLAWLDRLRTSVQDAGGKAGPMAFTDVCFSGNGGDMDDEDDEDDEGEDHDRSGGRRLTHAQRIRLVPVHEGNDCEVGEGNGDQGGRGDDNALQSSLPDSHKHRMEAKLTDLDEENLDDDNVGVANATYFAQLQTWTSAFSSRLNANVLAVDFRGFADSTGSPSEEGLVRDARAAYEWLINSGAKEEDIIIMGHSLGTGVGARLAAQLSKEE